jgi:arabinofuranan 3-O-arabinosyltransferase
VVLPALIAYVPLLLTQPGQVGADTKTYLYLDPSRLLAGATTMWDAETGMGTVSHQNIGYLFPMGPFYWVAETVGLPDWLAQRLWLGSILFLAALGVRFLLRTIADVPERFSHGAVLVAVLAYQLSPYVLDYSARISVILLPYVALPWLIALAQRSVRCGGWRAPACFALVALAAGGINATALVLMAVGPLLWFVYEWLVERVVPPREVLRAVWRCGLLTFATSLWWIAGLWAQGGYGLPVLRYTESYKTVAEASSATEVLRGLGYWYFYGEDKLGQWIEPSEAYTTQLWLLAVSFLVPVLALTAAALIRWRHRAYFLTLLVLGTLISVASHPWDGPSVLGGLFKAFTRTNAGLALRSTPRAVPLVALGAAVLLGAGVHAVGRRLPHRAPLVVALTALLVVANLPTLWNGTMVAGNLKRPEDLPAYWVDAIAALDARGDDTRILEIPGADFASYRWGNTVDPVTPGLTDRPYVARELFQYGTAPSANLLIALDRGLHDRTADADALATVATLMGVGDIVVRSDLQYERYRIARPRIVWDWIGGADGLDDPIEFGERAPNRAGPDQPLVDEIELGLDPTLEDPPPVAVFPVSDPRPIVRAVSAERPLLLAGDGEGLVAAAGAGLLDVDQAIFYSASFADDPEGFELTYGAAADLLVTDTNRARGRRWGGLRENAGYTEQADEEALRFDPTDNRLEVFPGAGSDTETVTEQTGAVTAVATAYGNPVTFTPDERAANAIDGDPLTAWRVGALGDPVGERLILDFDGPVTADRLDLTQPINMFRNRWVQRVRLHFDDGGAPHDAELGLASRDLPGEEVVFGPRTFEHLEIEILATDVGPRPRYDDQSGVGFSEVAVPGVPPTLQVVRPPTDLLDAAGATSIDHRLIWQFTRLRTDPSEPVRRDEEPRLARVVSTPADRSAALWGEARLSAGATDGLLSSLLTPEEPLEIESSMGLHGSLEDRPRSAFDGDLSTRHTTVFGNQRGSWVQVEDTAEHRVDTIEVAYVDDGRHSTPTRVRLDVDGVAAAYLDIPPPADATTDATTTATTADGTAESDVRSVTLPLPSPVTGRRFRLSVEAVHETTTIDWYNSQPIAMPVSWAEIGIDGMTADALPEQFDSGCRDDLVAMDGTPIAARVRGSTADALARRPLTLEACGAAADGVPIGTGDHVLTTTDGATTGLDIDQVLLSSERGGAPLPRTDIGDEVRPPAPEVTVEGAGRSSFDLEVAPTDEPYWLVLGQSLSPGWAADAAGSSLGAPTLVNGYANGWYVDPAEVGDPGQALPVRLDWTPQRVIWIALALSALASLVCVALALGAHRSRRRAHRRDHVGAHGSVPPVPGRPEAPTIGDTDPAPVVLGRRRAALASAGLALFVLADVPIAAALPAAAAVGVVSWLAFRRRRWAAVPGWLAAATYAAAGTLVVIGQFRFAHPADFVWPQQFPTAHLLALGALSMLAVTAVRDVVAPGGIGRRPGTTIAQPRPPTSSEEQP